MQDLRGPGVAPDAVQGPPTPPCRPSAAPGVAFGTRESAGVVSANCSEQFCACLRNCWRLNLGIAYAMHMHYHTDDRMTTLEQFVERSGGRAKAAVLIGIAETTLWRWTQGRSRPRGLALRRLTELGIVWEQGAATEKIARVVQVRPAAQAFAENEAEMLLGMLSMPPRARVGEVDLLRVRLGGLRQGCAKPARMKRVARVVRRSDALRSKPMISPRLWRPSTKTRSSS